jgi:uncharacterized protein (TIGR02646 family)
LIHIDSSTLGIRQEWIDGEMQATRQLMQMGDDERGEFIARNSVIWQRLKPELERISDGKCWYCEAKNIRFDAQVDHHRPKNKVKNIDGTEEPGYWWLAFDHTNFRLSCCFCNCLHKGKDGVSRGKANYFPLASGSCRAVSPQGLKDEKPLLLDPTNSDDPKVLWFLDDGRAYPKWSGDNDLDHQRASFTIDLLNLNDYRIVEERRKLWNHCMRLIERGDRAFYTVTRQRSRIADQAFIDVIREMLERVSPTSEYSATARACFSASASEWVGQVVS